MAKTKIGIVVSNKMKLTATVRVSSRVKHPLYKKQITKSKKIKARNEVDAKIGDKVKIVETKPYSKSVHFKIMEVVKK